MQRPQSTHKPTGMHHNSSSAGRGGASSMLSELSRDECFHVSEVSIGGDDCSIDEPQPANSSRSFPGDNPGHTFSPGGDPSATAQHCGHGQRSPAAISDRADDSVAAFFIYIFTGLACHRVYRYSLYTPSHTAGQAERLQYIVRGTRTRNRKPDQAAEEEESTDQQH